jgi:hypothetical protein
MNELISIDVKLILIFFSIILQLSIIETFAWAICLLLNFYVNYLCETVFKTEF